MAKVDPEQRRADVVEAVWRVVRRDGLSAASVRNVAQEAGLSMGSLRHYFASQAELLSFTLRAVIERIEARIAALPSEPDPRRRAERVLLELLPLDPERAAENEVWLAFTARAQVDPELRTVHDQGYDVLRGGCRRLVDGLAGEVVGLDVELETDRLHALLDGLAVHIAMRPDALTPDKARLIVARHLDELTRHAR
ncbi:TetR/AcrR family transcriptional regulator [Actinomadura violacea]|uniref:TetR family transcriptional regulator C-terminal domain-containing protein n=1 Tax=Actinomadura violacea TaxID=2819934 RepID=A0ABS3RL93_9ACTN|nr:TetR family transcriptional regulator C-terminal domain-containing protein [Actinomadura violacea]MBO2457504.1 TetR family transcriptional regulator C-terminal domain-containing protein [Actinomadura violacea]